MNDSYAEVSVKKKPSPSSWLIKIAMGVLTGAVLIFGNMFLGMLSMVLAVVLVIACVIVFPYLNVEYEYVYVDGQLDFDKIFSGNKRKTALRIDFENVEMMAPMNSHALDSYTHQQVKTMDFSSGEDNAKVYCIAVRKGEQLTVIMCEPSDKMIALIKQKYPRKISEY